MSIQLTEEQVLDIHLNSRINGGTESGYALMQKHGMTPNEYYSVMATDLKKALRKARAGKKFISWETGARYKKEVKTPYHGYKSHFFAG